MSPSTTRPPLTPRRASQTEILQDVSGTDPEYFFRKSCSNLIRDLTTNTSIGSDHEPYVDLKVCESASNARRFDSKNFVNSLHSGIPYLLLGAEERKRIKNSSGSNSKNAPLKIYGIEVTCCGNINDENSKDNDTTQSCFIAFSGRSLLAPIHGEKVSRTCVVKSDLSNDLGNLNFDRKSNITEEATKISNNLLGITAFGTGDSAHYDEKDLYLPLPKRYISYLNRACFYPEGKRVEIEKSEANTTNLSAFTTPKFVIGENNKTDTQEQTPLLAPEISHLNITKLSELQTSYFSSAQRIKLLVRQNEDEDIEFSNKVTPFLSSSDLLILAKSLNRIPFHPDMVFRKSEMHEQESEDFKVIIPQLNEYEFILTHVFPGNRRWSLFIEGETEVELEFEEDKNENIAAKEDKRMADLKITLENIRANLVTANAGGEKKKIKRTKPIDVPLSDIYSSPLCAPESISNAKALKAIVLDGYDLPKLSSYFSRKNNIDSIDASRIASLTRRELRNIIESSINGGTNVVINAEFVPPGLLKPAFASLGSSNRYYSENEKRSNKSKRSQVSVHSTVTLIFNTVVSANKFEAEVGFELDAMFRVVGIKDGEAAMVVTTTNKPGNDAYSISAADKSLLKRFLQIVRDKISSDLKIRAEEAAAKPFLNRQLFASNANHVLLTGPSSSGKTTFSKKLLRESNSETVKLPQILDSGVGQSPKLLRSLFESARKCLVFEDIDLWLSANNINNFDSEEGVANWRKEILVEFCECLDRFDEKIFYISQHNRNKERNIVVLYISIYIVTSLSGLFSSVVCSRSYCRIAD